MRGWKLSPATRAKQSEAMRRRWANPEYRARYRESLTRAAQTRWDGEADAGIINWGKVHKRLRSVRGRAAQYQCRCGKQAQEWAFSHKCNPSHLRHDDGSLWSTNINDYDPLCSLCHRRQDRDFDRMLRLRWFEEQTAEIED